MNKKEHKQRMIEVGQLRLLALKSRGKNLRRICYRMADQIEKEVHKSAFSPLTKNKKSCIIEA